MRSSTSFLSCVKKRICLLFCGYLCVNTQVDGALNRAVSFPEAVKACADSGSILAPASDVIGKQVPDDVTEVWDRSYQLEILIYYLGCAKVKSAFIIRDKRSENVITSECPQFCNQTLFVLTESRVGTIACRCPNTATINNLVMDNPGVCQPCSGSARYLCGGELNDEEIYIALFAYILADTKTSYVNGGGCQREECKNNRIHLSSVSCPDVNTYVENSELLHNGHFLSPSIYCSYPQNKGKAFHSWREVYPCVVNKRPVIDYCRSKISFAKKCSFLKQQGSWTNGTIDLCANETKFYICEGDSLNFNQERSTEENGPLFIWIFGSLAVTFILAAVIVFVFKRPRLQILSVKKSNSETPNHAMQKLKKYVPKAKRSVSLSNSLNKHENSFTNKSAFESKMNINQEIDEVLKKRKQLAAETENQVNLFCHANDNYDLVGGEDHIYELVADPEITKTIGHQYIHTMCKNASLNVSTECEKGELNCTATMVEPVYHILEKENDM